MIDQPNNSAKTLDLCMLSVPELQALTKPKKSITTYILFLCLWIQGRESRAKNSSGQREKKNYRSTPFCSVSPKTKKLTLLQIFNRPPRPTLREIGNVLISLNCPSNMGWVMGRVGGHGSRVMGETFYNLTSPTRT